MEVNPDYFFAYLVYLDIGLVPGWQVDSRFESLEAYNVSVFSGVYANTYAHFRIILPGIYSCLNAPPEIKICQSSKHYQPADIISLSI